MRILSSIVGALAVDMFCREAECPESRRVGPKLVCHDPGWGEASLLEQFSYQSFCGFRVAPALNEEVQNFTFIVDGSPKPIAFSPDHDDHFVKMPVIAGPWAGTAQIGSNWRFELQKPASDSLIGDVHASLSEHVLDIAEAQSEPRVEPNRMTDDLGRKTVTFERQLTHSLSLISSSLPGQPC
jgi:hypothetical protein